MPQDRLYDRLGGREGIAAVVDDFYAQLVGDDELGEFFEGSDIQRLRETQTAFLCEAAGGPETYELYRSLDEYGVTGEDADAVVEAVAAYQEELLARPNDGS
ncbi:group 1 truncated hemoglobin [Halobacteriales archaeon SW_8_65_20]|nr:MAG: group 1 truncated hemoglobin [Halobacteriales archaeon SW_8_65_20]